MIDLEVPLKYCRGLIEARYMERLLGQFSLEAPAARQIRQE